MRVTAEQAYGIAMGGEARDPAESAGAEAVGVLPGPGSAPSHAAGTPLTSRHGRRPCA